VITEDEATRLLERADPARRAVAGAHIDAADYLDALRTRSTTVTLINTEPTPTRTPRRRWPVVTAAAAAAAAVAVVVGVLVLIARDDNEPQVPTGPTPTTTDPAATAAEQIARDFLAAYAAFDADRALSYLTDAAVATTAGRPSGANTRDEFRLELALLEAQGYSETITGCEPRADSSSGTTVRCSYDFHGIRSDEMGLGPYSDNYWELTVRDGIIVSATNNIADATNGFSEQVWTPFAEWVAATYPDDVVTMYASGSQTDFRLSAESIRLWEQRSREYVDSRVGFVGLPPSGATPSSPTTPSKVVRHAEWCEPAIQGSERCANEGLNQFLLYADGRLIWSFTGDLPEGANPLFTGLLEQRLTPEGVEYFTTEFAEFEAGPSTPAVTYDGLAERLRDPSDWPAGTWADPEIKAYVPATYNVTFSRVGPPFGNEMLAILPTAAQDIVRDRNWGENRNGAAAFWGAGGIPTDDTRTLVDILDDAGHERGSEPYENPLRYRFNDPSSSATVEFEIKPDLPHFGFQVPR
jgi:hypothetical protein